MQGRTDLPRYNPKAAAPSTIGELHRNRGRLSPTERHPGSERPPKEDYRAASRRSYNSFF